MESQPQSPAEWQAYAASKEVTSIPLRQDETINESSAIAMFRDVYLDASKVLLPSMARVHIFTDVLAFNDHVTINPKRNGTVEIMARVVTANSPTKIVVPSDAVGALSLYAVILDQPITISTGTENLEIDLGPDSDYVGVAVSFTNGKLLHEYQKRFSPSTNENLRASLNTQLRISLILFWKRTAIAVSQCSYVAKVTSKSKEFNLLNTQAVALGQQLAGQVMAGPDMSYVPVLVLERYKNTTQQLLNAATAFELQYERFQDKKESVENLKKAWDAMVTQAMNERQSRVTLRDLALVKYNSAHSIAKDCEVQVQDDDYTLQILRIRFEDGFQKWKNEQQLKAVFQILMAVTTFAISVATIALGNPGGGSGAAESIGKAIEAVKAAEELTGQIGKILKSGTLQKLAEAVKSLFELYPFVESIVDAVHKSETNPDIDIPSLDVITGTSQGDADAAAIVTLAAWDKWVLESDEQLDFAVSEDIDGASEYRLGLRKHGINGKQLAQAQAEAVKAGYEYVQAQLDVILSDKQIENLQALRADYEGQEKLHAEAEAMFYDRSMALRTSVVMSLRNMIWAYKYWTLRDSSISLDTLKSVADYQQDLAIIVQELENADSRYSSDNQPFNYDINSNRLPANYGPEIIQGLKGEKNTASFTLQPDNDLASDFDEGYHYRLSGLNPTLRGVFPNPDAAQDGVVVVKLQITTSGIYQDMEKKELFSFASLPQVRRCHYDLDMDGIRGKTRIDSVFDTEDHAEPTPFTQWKIKVVNPEDLIMDGLQGVNLEFVGRVRFDQKKRRPHQVAE